MMTTIPSPSALRRLLGQFAATLLAALLGAAPVLAADPLQAFPQAEAGMVRHVIQLPAQDDEAALKVELIVGKTVQTDPANRYFFAGKLETENLPGWGYDRHILRQLGPMAGTLMGVDPKAPTVERFITLGGEPKLLRYNSRLPIVVYVPEGVELRHRLWRAGPVVMP
jgi:ecotin